MHVVLVQMPFAACRRPSLGLTQLQARLKVTHPEVHCEVVYPNMDAQQLLGEALYQWIADRYISGLGDWLFRAAAFPDAPDNTEAYLARHVPDRGPMGAQLRDHLRAARAGVAHYLAGVAADPRVADAAVVGFSSMFSQTVPALALCRLLKTRRPDIVTLMGGANCEYPMGPSLLAHADMLDYVFSGPALDSFPTFVGLLQTGTLEGDDLPAGVYGRHTPAKHPRGNTGRDLPIDTRIPLEYNSFLELYHRQFPDKDDVELTFETSRGCWWGAASHCSFCGLNSAGMAYRSMKPEPALRLLREVTSYAPRCKHFACVDNIMPTQFPREVLPRLTLPHDLSIFYEVKADLSDADLAVLAAARVTRVQPGIEALHTGTLKLMKKGTTAQGNIRFLLGCKRHGIFPDWNLLVGFPGEAAEVYAHYKDLLPKLAHLPPPSGCYPVRFDRYSPYFTQSAAHGLQLEPYDFYKDVFPWPEETLQHMAYYFQDTVYAADYARTMLRHVDALRALVAGWQARYAENPPVLHQVDDAHVEDSRNGTHCLHRLPADTLHLLSLLQRPSRRASLAQTTGWPAERVAEALAPALARDLVWQENDRLQSLLEAPAEHGAI